MSSASYRIGIGDPRSVIGIGQKTIFYIAPFCYYIDADFEKLPETLGQFLAEFQNARRSLLTFAARTPITAKMIAIMNAKPATIITLDIDHFTAHTRWLHRHDIWKALIAV